MKIALVGAGRYGKVYLDALFRNQREDAELVGVVEQNIENSPCRELLEAKGIPVYPSMGAFYRKQSADLMMLCTPPFLHAEQSIIATEYGSHVLCEKPVAPSSAECRRMLEAEEENGHFIAIGFQWSFMPAILALKRDILDGKLGKPVLLKTLISWPRDYKYYNPNGWNGKVRFHGLLTNDSIAFNACAHYIHNMLFLLGDAMDESAMPDRMEAECYRAYDIETYDTCFLRMQKGDTVMKFIASHAAKEVSNPQFDYVFENATVHFGEDTDKNIIATFKDGSSKNYGPVKDDMHKIDVCIDAVKNGEIPPCTVKTATPHARVIEKISARFPATAFPEEDIVLAPDRRYVKGLFEKMCERYRED